MFNFLSDWHRQGCGFGNAYLNSFVESFSIELVNRKIRVNSVSPGPSHTSIFKHMDLSEEDKEALLDDLRDKTLSKKIAEPEEIAKVIAFVLSDDSICLNGTDVLADNGFFLGS
jgi:NAD(P)-dependent dehydrogenase (short-subunit alcohol dehydrogenase family)